MSLFRFTQWISEGWPVMLYGDGQQPRDFTYVDDVARGTTASLKTLGAGAHGRYMLDLDEAVKESIQMLVDDPKRPSMSLTPRSCSSGRMGRSSAGPGLEPVHEMDSSLIGSPAKTTPTLRSCRWQRSARYSESPAASALRDIPDVRILG